MVDKAFRELVEVMISFIIRGEFTPSEMREAALLASLKYEYMYPHRVYIVDHALEDALILVEHLREKHNAESK